jgi:outer membrane protein TolC
MIASLLICSGFVTTAQEVLTLDSALAIGLERNFDIRIARNDQFVAANNARPGNANLLPTLSVLGGLNYSNSNVKQEFATGEQLNRDGAESVSSNASLNLDYVLFSGMGNMNTLKRLNEIQTAAELEYRLTVERNLVNIATDYYEVSRLFQNSIVTEEAIEVSLDRYKRAKERNILGSGLKLDLLNAEVDLNSDSVNYYTNLTDLNNAKRNLYATMGIAPSDEFEVDTSIFFQPTLNLDELRNYGLENNAQLLISERLKFATEYDLKAVKGGYSPEVALTGSYGYNRQDNQANFLSFAQRTGFNGGISLRWSLFEAQRRDTRVQNAKLNADSQSELLRQSQNDFLTNITNAYNTYVNSLYVMNMQKRNVVTNELNFERTQELFNLGQITNVQFRDAQLNLFQAKATYNNARFLAKVAEINLVQLSGKLLE